MGLNIKSDRVHTLAKRLAKATGKSMTAAIEEALDEKLARVTRRAERDAAIEDVLKRIRDLGPAPVGLTSDTSDLYDEEGMPR
jgi:antitoxin VapB